jgi:hypothetical protein
MARTSPDLKDIAPLGESDRQCLEEIREVLARYERLDRFGLTLLHDHFPLEDNELLMETCDPGTRTLTILPEVIDPTEQRYSVVATNWRFSAERGDVIAGLVCKVGCFVDLKDNHKKTHQRVNG